MKLNAFGVLIVLDAAAIGALAHTPLRRLLPIWPPLIVPGSRYWLAQAVAGAVLVAAALLLGAATLWLVRSRGARTRGRPPAPG
jgi:hypothetical protein